MLKSDKAPYFLTLMFAALGWTITHFTDSILSARAIKYDVNYFSENPNVPFDSKKPFCTMAVEVTNLTTDTFFKKLWFRFEIQNPDSTNVILYQDVKANRPLNFVTDQVGPVNGENTALYIEALHPQTSATIFIYYQGKTKPSLLLDVSDIGRNMDQPLLLIESGIRTYIIENETLLLLLIILVWIFSISWFVLKVK